MSKELEAIDNANPSEALMFIQELLNISETEKHFINLANYDTRLNLIKTKQALLKAQELEKVFEIINKKNVYIYSFKQALSVKQYNDFISFKIDYMDYMKLTQEEFDLLKRWLK